jgi:hypothetical protein
MADWYARAAYLLQSAHDAVEAEEDALPAATAAVAALRIAEGTLDAGELGEDGWNGLRWPDDPGPVCICPPDLKARGGWTSACPVCNPGYIV